MVLLATVIGRMGYYDVMYSIDSKTYKAKLPCEAIYESLISKGETVSLLIFVPESLAVHLAENAEQLDRLLKSPEDIREQFHKKLTGILPSANNNLDVSLAQSQGEYSNKNNEVSAVFENTVTNISLFMFSELLLFLREKKEKNVIVDISTGQNLYVTSLLDAVRGVLVYDKLNNIVQGERGMNVQIGYSPPIFYQDQSVKIECHPYDVKAFFELPIKEKNLNLNGLIKLSYIDPQRSSDGARSIYDRVKEFKQYLDMGRQAYNTLKYNTPLVLFHDLMSNKLKNFENIADFPERLYRLLDVLEKEHREVREENKKIRVIRNYAVNKDLYINLHYQLALLNSMYAFWRQMIEGREAELEYIRKTFSETYKKLGLGLNSHFLERDCVEISAFVNSYAGDLSSAKTLDKIICEQQDQKQKHNKKIASNEKRNFFAHSGFLRNITKVSKIDGKIVLSYDSTYEQRLESWMDNPEE